jgi:hypothetical protein
MFIATALGWGDVASIALAVGLAYLFGFNLTARPLVKAGLAAGTVISTALAVDTLSITIMEVIDNVFVVLVPGAMDARGRSSDLRQHRRRLRNCLPLRLPLQPVSDRPRQRARPRPRTPRPLIRRACEAAKATRLTQVLPGG